MDKEPEKIERDYYDGKYTVIYDPETGIRCQRHHEYWLAAENFRHINLIRHMHLECCELDIEVARLKALLEEKEKV